MKILTITLLLTVAIFLNSIELSSQTWIGRVLRILRNRRASIAPVLTYGISLRYYIDVNGREQPLRVGSPVTLGIRKLGEENDDCIIGVVKDVNIRPMIDYEYRRIVINMRTKTAFVPPHDMDVPYGLEPESLLEATIIPPPTDAEANANTPPQSPPRGGQNRE